MTPMITSPFKGAMFLDLFILNKLEPLPPNCSQTIVSAGLLRISMLYMPRFSLLDARGVMLVMVRR